MGGSAPLAPPNTPLPYHLRDAVINNSHFTFLHIPFADATPATHAKWDSSSSCLEGRGHVNVSTLQTFTSRLKTIIPSPAEFDRTYKTPCWTSHMHITPQMLKVLQRTNKHPLNDGDASALISAVFKKVKLTTSLVCLPQVYFMGFPRSGSTQLYKMLIEHPHIKGGFTKESHWWTKSDYKLKFPHDVLNIIYYIAYYQSHFQYIEDNRDTLLVDGSQSTIWDTRKTGNLCYLPQLFAELFPNAKYIVLMRDPTERLYSDFNYLCATEDKERRKNNMAVRNKDNSTLLFHVRVKEQISALEDCLQQKSLEHCTHHRLSGSDKSLCGHVRLGISLYHVHIKRWLREIPREQFLFLRTDDMATDPYKLLEKIWSFLGVEPQGKEDLQDILHEHLNSHQSHQSDMGRATVNTLRKFFQPHNDALAQLLGDDGFKWSGSLV